MSRSGREMYLCFRYAGAVNDMVGRFYVLGDDGETYEVEPDEFSEWAADADFRVAITFVGMSMVSTMFLGKDCNPHGDRRVLFETVIIGGELNGTARRYSTLEEAMIGHEYMVDRVLDHS